MRPPTPKTADDGRLVRLAVATLALLVSFAFAPWVVLAPRVDAQAPPLPTVYAQLGAVADAPSGLLGFDWDSGAQVTVDVLDGPGGAPVMDGGAPVYPDSPWTVTEQYGRVELEFWPPLQPGWVLSVTGPSGGSVQTVETVVTDLRIDGWDFVTEIISGTTSGPEALQISLFSPQDVGIQPIVPTATADPDVWEWSADLGAALDPGVTLELGATAGQVEHLTSTGGTFASFNDPVFRLNGPIQWTVGLDHVTGPVTVEFDDNDPANAGPEYSIDRIADRGRISFQPAEIPGFDEPTWDAFGWTLTATAGGETVAALAVPLALDAVNTDTNEISGRGEPGVVFDLDVQSEPPLTVTVPASGLWTATSPIPVGDTAVSVRWEPYGGNSHRLWLNQQWPGFTLSVDQDEAAVPVYHFLNNAGGAPRTVRGFWPPNTTVHVEIDDPANVYDQAFDLTADENGHVEIFLNSWPDTPAPPPGWQDIPPGAIGLGWQVSVGTSIDGIPLTKTLAVNSVTIDAVDFEAGTASGGCDQGSQEFIVQVQHGGYDSGWSEEYDEPCVGGSWAIGFTPPAGEWVQVISNLQDGDGDVFAARVERHPGPTLDPFVMAYPAVERVHANGGWPVGAELTLTIEDPATQRSPDYTDTTIHPPYEHDGCCAFFELAGYDLKAADVVTLTGGGFTRQTTVTALTVNVNPDTNVLSGAADNGPLRITIQSTDPWVDYDMDVTDGSWTVDFTGIHDLGPGDRGTTQQNNGGGGTWVDWQIPELPSFRVDTPYLVSGSGEPWPLGATVELIVDDGDAGNGSPDYTATTVVESWGPNPWDQGFAFWLDQVPEGEIPYEIQPGHTATVTATYPPDPAVLVTKTLVVENITIDQVNVDTGVVSGHAPPDAWVSVNAGNEFEWAWRNVQAAPAGAPDPGYWEADLGNEVGQGEEGDGILSLPLQPGTGIGAQVFDEDGDSSHRDWCLDICGPGGEQPQLMLVSYRPDGSQVTQGQLVVEGFSGDGNVVALREEGSSDLLPGDTNGFQVYDLYTLDWRSGTATRISVSYDGSQANARSGSPQPNYDGSLVAFWSTASNLVPNDGNGAVGDNFIWDANAQTNQLITLDQQGGPTDDKNYGPRISADGTQVAFYSDATDLVPDDTNGVQDLFVRDLTSGATERVTPPGDEPNGAMGNDLAISGGGQFVAFSSYASNLVPEDPDATEDVFLYDRGSGVITLVSVAFDGGQANGASSYATAVSEDGRFVLFQSVATNLVENDTNGVSDVFLRDTHDGWTMRVSVAGDGSEANGPSTAGDLTPDGRYATFHSAATNLVGGDDNNSLDAFWYDTHTGELILLSHTEDGTPGAGQSWNPLVSDDGRFVAFSSEAPDLVPEDTNGTITDVFVYDLGPRDGGGPGGGGPFDFYAAGDYLVSQTEGQILVWSQAEQQFIGSYGLPVQQNYDIHYLDRETLLFTGNGGVQALELWSGNVEQFLPNPPEGLAIMDLHPTDPVLFVGSGYGSEAGIHAYDYEAGTLTQLTDTLTPPEFRRADHLTVGPDGWIYFTASSEPSSFLARVHPDGTFEELIPQGDPALPAGSAFSAVEFRPDGTLVIGRTGAKAILERDPSTGAVTTLYEPGPGESFGQPDDLVITDSGKVAVVSNTPPALYEIDLLGTLTTLHEGGPIGDAVEIILALDPPQGPPPGMAVFPDNDRVQFEGSWGDPIEVTIDEDADPGNGFLYQVTVPGGDGGSTALEFDIQRGQWVILDDGQALAKHQVMNLYLDGYDVDADTMWGRADEGSIVYAQVQQHWGGEFSSREVVVGDDASADPPDDGLGAWLADFSVGTGEEGQDPFDIRPGTQLIPEQRSGDGETDVDVRVPLQRFTVNPDTDDVWGQEWTEGTFVVISVDAGDPANPLFTSASVPVEAWGPSPWDVGFGAQLPFDVQAGHFVTVTDGDAEKRHEVTLLTVDGVDDENDLVFGRAEPFSEVQVALWGSESENHTERTVTAGADLDDNVADGLGPWEADFGQPGPEEWQIARDILPDTGGGAWQGDDDGDQTQIDFGPGGGGEPLLIGQYQSETSVFGNGFEGFGSLQIRVANDPSCPGVVDVEAEFEVLGTELCNGNELVEGHHITVSVPGGEIVRDLTFHNLVVTAVDVEEDSVSGLGTVGTPVEVQIENEGDPENPLAVRYAEPGGDGTWTVSFNQPPDLQAGETGTLEIDGMFGDARQYEEDGDFTNSSWFDAQPGLFINLIEDRVVAEAFPTDTVTVSVFSVEGGALLVEESLTRPSPYFAWTGMLYLGGIVDVVSGNHVVATGGAASIAHTVRPIAIDRFDFALDRIEGKASPVSPGIVRVGAGNDDAFAIDEPAVAAGEWTADFADRVDFDTHDRIDGFIAEFDDAANAATFLLYEARYVQESVPPGGTGSSGAGDAVEVEANLPGGGEISFTESPATGGQIGFQLIGNQIDIWSSVIGTVESPLILTFHLLGRELPAGEDETTIMVFKDGVLVPECVPVPDQVDDFPCVSNRAQDPADGDVFITVHTLELSIWTLGFRALYGGEITGPTVPILVATPVTLSATFDDRVGSADETVEWAWGDDTTTTCSSVTPAADCSVDSGVGLATGTHVYATPGVYTVTATVTNPIGSEEVLEFRYVVVYDPDDGFVTGGGWIHPDVAPHPELPPSDYPGIDPTDKVNLGFNVKYLPSSTVPQGQLNVQLGAMHVHSDAIDWLVISVENEAYFSGLATVDGGADLHPFRVNIFDGDSDVEPDWFEMKLFDVGADPNDEPPPLYYVRGDLGGGQVKIHDN